MGRHESKFRVGDRVNWMRVRGEFDGSTIEEINEQRGYGWPVTIRASNGQKTYAAFSELEPAPLFAVGDKVRVVTMEWGKEQHGKTGTVICNNEISSFSDLDVTIEYDVPLGALKTNSYRSSGLELIPSATSCAAAEVDNLADEYGPFDDGGPYNEFRIQAGRYYKTRDGRKVGPMRREESHYATDGWHYDIAGKCAYEGGSRDEVDEAYRQVHDLIAEWSEDDVPLRGVSPVKVVAPATTAKFKVGDRVITNGGYSFDPGFGIIAATYDKDSDLFFVEVEDKQWQSKTWSYRTASLALAPAVHTTMADIVRKHSAVVMLIEDGQPKPATRPYVHADRAAATTEAERLATTMPGSEFGVYELVTRRAADVVVREVA